MNALLLCLALCSPTQEAAAPGRWSAAAGDSAGSSRSFARPLREEPLVSWSWQAPAPIEGAVSSWDGRALLSLRESSSRRALVLLEIETGELILKETLRATQALEPCMDGDAICVRPSAERVDVYRLRDGRIGRPRAIRAERSISAPLLVEGELYLRVDDTLKRFETNRNGITWSAALPGVVRGRPALFGQQIFTLFYTPDGTANIGILDRDSGRLLVSASVGDHGGTIPAVDASASLHPSASRVFLRYPLPVRNASGTEFSYASRELRGQSFSTPGSSLHQYQSAPIVYGSGWITEEGVELPSWIQVTRERETWSVQTLADVRTQPQLRGFRAPPSLAGEVIYFGGLAADMQNLRILWKRKPWRFQPTPIDGGLLVVEEGEVLRALREPAPQLSPAQALARRQDEALEQERALLLAELAKGSTRIGDVNLTRRMIDRAQRHGASASQVAPALRAMDRIAANSKRANPTGNKYRALLAEEAALMARPAAQLAQLAAQKQGAERLALLRVALERDPQEPQAMAQVRALLPAGAVPSEPFPALGWLEFLEISLRIPVQLSGPRSPDWEQRNLALERDAWRPDLSGFRSERLFIIAPHDRPGAVARCLETGEFLADILEELFADSGVSEGAADEPLQILLYPTRQEYITQSTRASSAPEAAFGWTAGHYSSRENRSRLFVPDDFTSTADLLEVYAHELTHHWLATRSPFASRQGSLALPYWIVEGFATLVSEFSLAPERQSWDARNPRAGSLEKLRALPESALLPWSEVLQIDFAGFARLGKGPRVHAPLTWTLGLSVPLSATQLFYIQASALAQMLYNGSPSSKAQLLDYVRAWYAVDADAMDPTKSFGAEPASLGLRTLEYAKRAQR